MLGYTAEEYIGKPVWSFIHPDDIELIQSTFLHLLSGKPLKNASVRYYCKDGGVIPLLVDSNVSYDETGNFKHTRCFLRDDTGRKVSRVSQ